MKRGEQLCGLGMDLLEYTPGAGQKVRASAPVIAYYLHLAKGAEQTSADLSFDVPLEGPAITAHAVTLFLDIKTVSRGQCRSVARSRPNSPIT